MFCPLGALRVAKGACDFCDEATLEEMKEDVFSCFENSNNNAFFQDMFWQNFHDCASPHDKISESIPLGGSSSVRNEIPDFTGARSREKTAKIWQNHGVGNF